MRLTFVVAALVAALACTNAQAEIARSSPSAAAFHFQADTAASPDRAWQAVTNVGHWWGSDHTYSGNALNMRLDPRAGGCWCERSASGQVEHMRVVLVTNVQGERTLRLVGGLGPLQAMAVNGVMTFTITPHGDGSTITLDYLVTGDSSAGLDQIASGVDHVLTEQFDHLIRYTRPG